MHAKLSEAPSVESLESTYTAPADGFPITGSGCTVMGFHPAFWKEKKMSRPSWEVEIDGFLLLFLIMASGFSLYLVLIGLAALIRSVT